MKCHICYQTKSSLYYPVSCKCNIKLCNKCYVIIAKKYLCPICKKTISNDKHESLYKILDFIINLIDKTSYFKIPLYIISYYFSLIFILLPYIILDPIFRLSKCKEINLLSKPIKRNCGKNY